nr:hypothetical protein CFP56_71354 [Quercus suber]
MAVNKVKKSTPSLGKAIARVWFYLALQYEVQPLNSIRTKRLNPKSISSSPHRSSTPPHTPPHTPFLELAPPHPTSRLIM